MNKYLFALLLFVGVACGTAMAQNIGGIGAQLILDTTGGHTMPRIYSLVQGSPAWDSLRATDYIISVSGVSCRDKTINDVVALIRGEAGTMVTVTTANTRDGDKPRVHELRRVGMNIPQPATAADPKDAFFTACDAEVKQMKQNGAVIIKTFNSDCGSYFFNFNAPAGTYRIKVLALTDAGGDFYATAKAFDNDHEADATDLGRLDSKGAANNTAQLTGKVTFARECVGTVGITLHDDGKQCRAMYVVVSRF